MGTIMIQISQVQMSNRISLNVLLSKDFENNFSNTEKIYITDHSELKFSKITPLQAEILVKIAKNTQFQAKKRIFSDRFTK